MVLQLEHEAKNEGQCCKRDVPNLVCSSDLQLEGAAFVHDSEPIIVKTGCKFVVDLENRGGQKPQMIRTAARKRYAEHAREREEEEEEMKEEIEVVEEEEEEEEGEEVEVQEESGEDEEDEEAQVEEEEVQEREAEAAQQAQSESIQEEQNNQDVDWNLLDGGEVEKEP